MNPLANNVNSGTYITGYKIKNACKLLGTFSMNKNSWITRGGFHVNSASYPPVMPGGNPNS